MTETCTGCHSVLSTYWVNGLVADTYHHTLPPTQTLQWPHTQSEASQTSSEASYTSSEAFKTPSELDSSNHFHQQERSLCNIKPSIFVTILQRIKLALKWDLYEHSSSIGSRVINKIMTVLLNIIRYQSCFFTFCFFRLKKVLLGIWTMVITPISLTSSVMILFMVY